MYFLKLQAAGATGISSGKSDIEMVNLFNYLKYRNEGKISI
jgi:hypothetical protein